MASTPLPLVPGPAVAQPALTYDATSERVVAFGPSGIDGMEHPGVTYAWDRASWTTVATQGEIPGFTNAGLASEPGSRRLLLFGGFLPFAYSDQTWALEDGRWRQLHPASHPSAQAAPAMAIDVTHGQLLLFGGCCGPGTVPNGGAIPLAETWTWTGVDWHQLNPAHSPPARREANLVRDPDGQRLVLFGGYGRRDQQLLDTWTWDGADWHQQLSLDPGAYPNAAGSTLAYDGARHRLLLFISLRGNDKSWGPLLWTLPGQGEWIVDPLSGPPMGIRPQLVWNPTRGEVLLFDPLGASRPAQTWTFNGTAWLQRTA